jgi:hypothetical protein
MNGRLSTLWLLSLALWAFPPAGGAYETDQFSHRLEPIADSTEIMDEKVNASIESAVAGWRGPRSDWKFVNLIYHDLGGHHWVDRIERWAMKSDEVERLQTSRRESIYQGHPFWATRVAGIFGVGPTIQLNGVLIGSDKLGHFFSQGRKFYRRFMRNGDEAQAAEHSAFTERALFGQMTTGVYSNADLVANYEGFRFYLSLFEDNVVPGKPAILAWREDHWEIQRPFTWADHVNEYWDEALNINHFDRLLHPHMQRRLTTFCPDYFEAPEKYRINQATETDLIERYQDLELRDTSDLRLDNLCAGEANYPAMGSAAGAD